MTIAVNKQLFTDRGFTVTPEKATALPPGESIEMTITLSTNPRGRSDFPFGKITQDMIIDLNSNGPKITVILEANVVDPDIVLPSEPVDFGTVQTGNCYEVTIKLQNEQPVPCEWAFTRLSKNNACANSQPHFKTKSPNKQSDYNCFK